MGRVYFGIFYVCDKQHFTTDVTLLIKVVCIYIFAYVMFKMLRASLFHDCSVIAVVAVSFVGLAVCLAIICCGVVCLRR
jgi:hypothetical protein